MAQGPKELESIPATIAKRNCLFFTQKITSKRLLALHSTCLIETKTVRLFAQLGSAYYYKKVLFAGNQPNMLKLARN